MRKRSFLGAAVAATAMVSGSVQAGKNDSVPGTTELRVVPTSQCLWSHHKVEPPGKDRTIGGAIFEALAPGLIDTGIAWIGEMLKKAGERKVVPRYGASGIAAGPDYPLPACLQLVYGTFSFSEAAPTGAQPKEVVNQELWKKIDEHGFLRTTDGKAPHLWMEVEIHYFPEPGASQTGYQQPTAYALVPTRLNWNRSIIDGKPASQRDLLVFINVTQPSSAANEATTGFTSSSASVARLSWYGLAAGKPEAIDTVFSGRKKEPAATPAAGAKVGESAAVKDTGELLVSLPPTASAWSPFPSTEKNQPLVFWANVTEARDGNVALAKLGEALAARKTEVATALGTAIIPSKKEAAELTAETAAVADYKSYIVALTAAQNSEGALKSECRKLDAVIASKGAESDEAIQAERDVRAEAAKWLEHMDSANLAGSKLDPKQKPFADPALEKIQLAFVNNKVCSSL